MSKAVVVGATGAVGKGEHVVGCLLLSDKWKEVVTVGRRPVALSPDLYNPANFKAKLEQVQLNMDNLKEEGKPAFEGAHAVFCCLGTDRKAAGSAEQFLKVDLEYVKSSADAAKAAGAKHFSMLSAQGANANVWANNWVIFHALLYTQAKGKAEEHIRAAGFPTSSFFRPGFIERGHKARPFEKAFAWISNIPSSGLAKLMVMDAEAALSGAARPPAVAYDMASLQRALKQGGLPTASQP